MTVKADQLWNTLRDARVVQGDAPSLDTLASPWYVRVLLGFSGWLAALFILFFIGAALAFIVRNNTASLITGFILIGAAYAIFINTRGDFVEQLALAASIAGQGLVIHIIFKTSGWSGASPWMLTALLHAGLAILMPNFVHRAFSAFFASFSFSFALTSAGVPYLFSGLLMFPVAFIWLNEIKYPKYLQSMRAIGYGLVLGLVNIKGSALFAGSFWWIHRSSAKETWVQPWMGETLAGAVMIYVVWQLLARNGHRIPDRIAIAALLATGLIFAVSLEANGITVGIMIMLLGFANSNRILLGLGVVSTLFYVSSYYYMMNTTLLAKSQTLLLTGLALLLLRWLMLRFISDDGGQTNAR